MTARIVKGLFVLFLAGAGAGCGGAICEGLDSVSEAPDEVDTAGRWLRLFSPGARVALGLRERWLTGVQHTLDEMEVHAGAEVPAAATDRARWVGAYRGQPSGDLLILTTSGELTLEGAAARSAQHGTYVVLGPRVELHLGAAPVLLAAQGDELIETERGEVYAPLLPTARPGGQP